MAAVSVSVSVPTFFILDLGFAYTHGEGVAPNEGDPTSEPVLTIATTWYPMQVKVGWNEVLKQFTPRVIPKFLHLFRLKESDFKSPDAILHLNLEFNEYLRSLGLGGLIAWDKGATWVRKEILKGNPVDYSAFMATFLEGKGFECEYLPKDPYVIPPRSGWTKQDHQMMNRARKESSKRAKLLV